MQHDPLPCSAARPALAAQPPRARARGADACEAVIAQFSTDELHVAAHNTLHTCFSTQRNDGILSSCCSGPPHWCRWRCRCAWWWPRRCAAWGGWTRRRRTSKCWQVGSPTARHRRLDRLRGTGPGWFGHTNPRSITCPQLLLSLAVSQTHCPLLPGWVTEGEAAFGEMSGSAPVSIHQQALRGIALVRAWMLLLHACLLDCQAL